MVKPVKLYPHYAGYLTVCVIKIYNRTQGSTKKWCKPHLYVLPPLLSFKPHIYVLPPFTEVLNSI